MLAPFVLSAAFWVISFAQQILRVKIYFVNRAHRQDESIGGFTKLFAAIVSVNVCPLLSTCVCIV